MAKVHISTSLRSFTRLLDDKGAVRRYVNIFHNDEDTHFLQDLETPAIDGERLTIIPATAGGEISP
jgi:molybdopterin converting factor small subunit